METPENVRLAGESREMLVARISNYEEAMAEALKRLEGVPGVEDVREMLTALLQASGKEHLDAIQSFELAVTAVMAFKDRALASLIGTVCPECGGEQGQHLPDCLLGTSLRVAPSQLPKLEPTAYTNLVGLQLRLRELLRRNDGGEDFGALVHAALKDFPPPDMA